jgi:uncharacterized surface protein with fasciclin (FAS1) repeats
MRQLLLAGALALALTACNKGEADANATATNQAKAEVPKGTIADSLANTRLAAAVRAAGLERTLSGPGPYTVLAPSDDAFAKLPSGRAEALMRPEAKAELTALLTNHILPGTMLIADIGKAIDNGRGKTVLATMGGGKLTAAREGNQIVMTDENGGRAVLAGEEKQYGNGVVHPIDSVLTPKS